MVRYYFCENSLARRLSLTYVSTLLAWLTQAFIAALVLLKYTLQMSLRTLTL